MTYRILNPDEWPRLAAYMESYGQQTPYPEACLAAVAEDAEGKIQGVLFMQIQWHCEPLVLSKPDVRYDRLFETLKESFKDHQGTHFYCYTNSPEVSRMAASMGLEAIGTAYRGEF